MQVSYLRYGLMVRHVIDKKSPIFGHTMESLRDGDASFSLTIMGLERTSMQPIFHLEVSEATSLAGVGLLKLGAVKLFRLSWTKTSDSYLRRFVQITHHFFVDVGESFIELGVLAIFQCAGLLCV